jgi:hypothetical protein
MRGLADSTGLDYDTIRRIHMLGEFTKGDCSMFGAWGTALPGGSGLLTMRALDWNMEGPFRSFPQLTVYHPAPNSTENAFVNLGWTGWVGSITGVNDQQMSIHEIGVAKPDSTYGPESDEGIPFTFILRDVLQFDKCQLDGLSRLASAHRTCNLILGIGDGKVQQFNSVQYSYSVCNIMSDYNLKPIAPWHPRLENVVYHGMDWMCPGYNEMLHSRLASYHGALTPEIAIRNVMSVVTTGNLHIMVNDLVAMQMYISKARRHHVTTGPLDAYDRSYIQLDLNGVFAILPPSVTHNHARARVHA